MEKYLKKMKVFIVILLVIVVSLIAFWGVFKKEKGVWNNLIPDYQYGMDLNGTRELRYAVDNSEEEKYVYVDENGNVVGEVWKDGNPVTAEDEASSDVDGQEGNETENTEQAEEVPYAKETRTIKANSDEVLTKENFEKVKKTIQSRLKEQKISEYNIRIDDVTGQLVVETSNDNDDVELVENLVGQAGKFQIIDYQNGQVLMDNSDIKNATVVYSNNSTYNTYLQIEFNKNGAEKLKNISTKYVEIVNEANENTEENSEVTTEKSTETTDETDEETTKKYVSVVFDDTTMMTTYFGEEMDEGILQISVGEATSDYEEFKESYESAKIIADLLNSGVLPVTYNIESDNFVKSEITTAKLNIIKTAVAIFVAIISLVLIAKFKKNGLLSAILAIGYIAIFTIVTKYTNVVMTANSVIAYGLIVIMNYIFINMFMKRMKEKETSVAFNEAMKKFYLYSIPVSVIAIVFTFATQLQISSIGMIVFWGMILIALYNLIFTRTVFVNLKNK